MSVKPEKIVLTSLDSIEIKNMPAEATYMSVLQTFKENFAIFFEDHQKKKIRTKGEISYYFEVSQQISLKDKINAIFESIGEGNSSTDIIN